MEYDTARRTETALYGFVSFERYRLPTEHNKASRAQNKGQKLRTIIQTQNKASGGSFLLWADKLQGERLKGEQKARDRARASLNEQRGNREKRSSLYPPVATSPDGTLSQMGKERVYTERGKL